MLIMKVSGPVSVWLQDVAKGCWNSKSREVADRRDPQ